MKTDYEFLKTDIDGHILTVTINRPERMNALHPPAGGCKAFILSGLFIVTVKI